VLGGRANDEITSGAGHDDVMGDAGAVPWSHLLGETTIERIETSDAGPTWGPDQIDVGNGDNVGLAGDGRDTVDSGEGGD
ncbi:hypothetical protein Q4578_20715, partial [Shimia thalassica]|nr:hypothetical protein [Shimia thalassica]